MSAYLTNPITKSDLLERYLVERPPWQCVLVLVTTTVICRGTAFLALEWKLRALLLSLRADGTALRIETPRSMAVINVDSRSKLPDNLPPTDAFQDGAV